MDPTISRLTDTRCRLAESPTWDARTQRLYWCDILGRRLHALDWASGAEQRWDMPDVISAVGLTRNPETLVAALRDRVGLLDLETGGFETLVEIEADRPHTRLNDGKVGPDGAFWIGSMDDRPDRQPIAALYRVTATGDCTRLVEDLMVSNGLAWSPDGRTLYHADSRPGWVDAWAFDPGTGAIANRRRFAQMTDETGRPDGGTVDADGHYWSAGVSAGVLNRFAPDGTRVASLPLPAPKPTMPCFCGPDLDTLAITTLQPPADPGAAPDTVSGYLYRLTPGPRGLPGYLFGA